MNGLTVTVAIFGLITSTIAILTALLKIVNHLNALKTDLKETNWRIKTLEALVESKHDSLELTINGVRERQEHVAARIQVYVEKNAGVIEDIESYLQKNTPYERRSGR